MRVNLAGKKSLHFMKDSQNAGFSLIELMIVFSIIFVTVGLALPGLYTGRERAARIECANNLKQAAQVLSSWAKDHEKFPSTFKELLEERYIDSLDIFRCSVTKRASDWEFKAAGRKVNDLKPSDELIHCRHCNLSVHLDTHVEFLK